MSKGQGRSSPIRQEQEEPLKPRTGTGRRGGAQARSNATADSEDPDSASRQIDVIVQAVGDWRGQTLSELRAAIRRSDPAIVEEVKWKKPSNPSGVPVWSHDGIVCIGETLKNAVRLTFPQGAQCKDPERLFNTRLDSKTVRAIDFHLGAPLNEPALRALIADAAALNTSKRAGR